MIRSEFLNLRSTPTAWILLACSIVMAAVSLLANLSVFDTTELAATASIEQAMHSSTVATMTFALIAGIVGATSDYRFGRMDQLLLSNTRPSHVIASKTFVGFVLGVLYGTAGSAVALTVMSIYYRVNDVAIDLTSWFVVGPLLGVVLASGLFVVLGIGLGSVIRNQPAAIATGLALLLVLQPPMLLGLPDVGRWLPGAAGLSMTLAPDSALLGQAAGAIVLIAWVIVAVVAGDRRLRSLGA